MKKTKYYLKFGEQTSTYGVDTRRWYKDFSREFSSANEMRVYLDKNKNHQLYCYEQPTKLLQQEWGQSMFSLHSADLLIDYVEEVEIEEQITKLESIESKGSGVNWKSRNRGGKVKVSSRGFENRATKIYPSHLDNQS